MATMERSHGRRRTGPPVRIRRMRAADLARVIEIEYGSYSTPWSEATFRGLLRRSDADMYVADADGDAAGYAVFWSVGTDGELGNIAVAPEWRGRGVARQLLESVFAGARDRGVERIYLEVRVSNLAARKLYDAYGFRPVGRRPGYYHSPVEDALVLSRDLEPDGGEAG